MKRLATNVALIPVALIGICALVVIAQTILFNGVGPR